MPMAGNGGMGGIGGSGGSGAGGATGGVGGTSGAGAGGSAGSAGSAGMDPDEDAAMDPMDPMDPVALPSDGEQLAVCFDTDACNGDDLVCVQFDSYQGYCADDCSEDSDCPDIEGIEGTCDNNDRCVIDCVGDGEGDGECPASMECVLVTQAPLGDPPYRCQDPEAKSGDVYDRCDADRGDADCKEDLSCEIFPGPTDARDSICAAGCMEDDDCDDLGSDATPVCDLAPLSPLEGICGLDCAEDDECPDGLTCLQVAPFSYRCGHEL